MTSWYFIRHAEKERGNFFNPHLRHQDGPISQKGRLEAQNSISLFLRETNRSDLCQRLPAYPSNHRVHRSTAAPRPYRRRSIERNR